MESEVTIPRRGLTALVADFAMKLKALGVDTKAEEHRLRGIIGELVAFAEKMGEATPMIQCANSVLSLSVTEWQSLTTQYPEKSFRSDLNRVLRRAVGLVAAIQEGDALYRVHFRSDQLEKKPLQWLIYLGYCAGQILPELERLEQEARGRGLEAKAGHLQEVIRRLVQHCQQIAEIKVEGLGGHAGKSGS